MKIIKRSGKEMEFDKQKIINAISKANQEEKREHLRLSEYQIKAIADIIENKQKAVKRVKEQVIAMCSKFGIR